MAGIECLLINKIVKLISISHVSLTRHWQPKMLTLNYSKWQSEDRTRLQHRRKSLNAVGCRGFPSSTWRGIFHRIGNKNAGSCPWLCRRHLEQIGKKETLISLSLLIDTIKIIAGFKSLVLKKTNKKKVNKQTHNLCACHFSIMNKCPTNSWCHHI